MIRVLHICAALDGGGVDRFLLNYWQAANKEILHFDFVVHSNKRGILEDQIEELGSAIYHVVPKTEDFIGYLKQMTRIFKEGSYDIVHCHQGYNSYIPLINARRCGITNTIAHAHTAFEPESRFSSLLRKISSYLTRITASQLAACSQDAGLYMWGTHSFTVLEDAIDLSAYAFSQTARSCFRDRLGFSSKFVVGCVGRLCPSKNHMRLLNIFRLIQSDHPESALLIVGTGSEEQRIKKTADQLKLRNVCLFGVSNQTGQLLSAMDVFVLPTLYEGFGMAFLEAQANGLNTFASKTVVPEATRISDLIHYIPLEATDSEWASCITKYMRKRTKFEPLPQADDYDIKIKADQLCKYYLDICKDDTKK
ncbi:MAG: glycosyltransferase [Oscillospiraceae bacterium]|nr:glycosyltransferase [Oscillospiraceae bacterium]